MVEGSGRGRVDAAVVRVGLGIDAQVDIDRGVGVRGRSH